MTELQKRIVFGAIFGIILLISLLFSTYTSVLLFFIVSIIAHTEFVKMVQNKYTDFTYFGLIIGGCILIIDLLLKYKGLDLTFFYGFFILLLPIFAMLYHKAIPFEKSVFYIGQVLYCTFTFKAIIDLVNLNETANYYLLYLFIIIWCNDTFAYFVGKKFGKTKLFQTISPKKTIEGLIAGLFMGCVASVIIAQFGTEIKLLEWLILALITGLLGTIGDLIESMVKRYFEVKDSGTIIPGHGGVLDRFDSVMIAVLLYYPLMKLFLG